MPTAQEALAELARRELARREARSSLRDFCFAADPMYEETAHTRLLCRHLDALAAGEIDKLAIFMPPRCGKTYHAAERFPAYFIGKKPDAQIITTSYTIDRAVRSSRRVRGLIRERERWPWPAIDLSGDSTAVETWETNAGGVMKAAGVGGSITGFGAHLLIIDDPIKDRQEADSASNRDRQWSWYTEVARTRLMRGGRQLVMMTRWHTDDLAGRILNSVGANEWTVLSLPWFAEEHDPLGREIGAPLWPGGPPVPDVAKGEIGARAFQALYQQRPTAEQGNLFQRAWFEHRADPPRSFRSIVQAIDCAAKTGIANDFSTIATWGFDGARYHVVDVWREKVEFPDLVRAVVAAHEWYQPSAILVEDASAGTQLIQQLRQSALPIITVPALGSKVSRAEAITPIFESGRVTLPIDAPWLHEFIEEHVAFPHGKHDDQVDTTSMALARLSQTINRPFAVRL